MAYVYIPGKTMANRAAGLTELWTFFSNVGWTLHDNQDGSSFRVYSSSGELGDRITEYVLVDYATANFIYFRAYYKWEVGQSTKGGADQGQAYYSTSTTHDCRVATSESGFDLYIHGNKDLVVVTTKISSAWDVCGFGHVPKRFDTTLAEIVSAVTSGSDVDIEVDSVDGFVVGGKYLIVGADDEGADHVTITDIVADPYGAGTLTVETLSISYSSGSLIGYSPSTFCTIHFQDDTNHTYQYCYPTINTIRSGVTNHTAPYERGGRTHIATNDSGFTTVDPGYRTGEYVALPLTFVMNENISSYSVDAYGSMWAYDDTFIYTTEKLTSDDILAIGVRVRSTATGAGGGNNTLADTGKSWATNIHSGKVVLIKSGTGNGQIRKIVSNTATELTLDFDWYTSIDGTSEYVIADEGFRYLYGFTIVREGY